MTGRKVRVAGMRYVPHSWMRCLGNAERGFSFRFRDRIWKVRPLSGEEGEPEEVLFKAMCWLFRTLSACIGSRSSNMAACWDLNTPGLFSSGLGWTVDVPSSNLWTTSLKTHFSLWDSVAISTEWRHFKVYMLAIWTDLELQGISTVTREYPVWSVK